MFLYRIQNGCYRVREVRVQRCLIESRGKKDEDTERVVEVVRWASKVFFGRLLKDSLATGPSHRLTEA